MITFFCLILVVGSIPIRIKAFKSNKVYIYYISQRLLAFTAAFSGGLFLSVGVIHLLPEAAESFNEHFESLVDEGQEPGEHFPFAYTIAICSFALILFIEKVAIGHSHAHGDEHDHSEKKKSYIHSHEQNALFVENKVDDALLINNSEIIPQTEEAFK